MARFSVNPKKTALLVVDMQNVFVEGALAPANGLEILDRLNQLAAACRRAGIQVVHTAHVVRPDGSNVGVMGEVIPPVKAGAINDGSESAALHNGLEVAPSDIFLKKPRFGAFHGTDLELILRAKDIDTVIIGGIATNVCAETTAREANVRDFRVIFLRDGTATFPLPDLGLGEVSAEEIQKAVCSTLAFAFADVSTVAEVLSRVEDVAPGNGPEPAGVSSGSAHTEALAS